MVPVQSAKGSRMKIAELCAVSGMKKATIHSYLRMGLLPPPLRVGANLHLYNDTHLQTLSRIRSLRERDKLSLTQIRDLLKNGEAPPQRQGQDGPVDAPTAEIESTQLQPGSYRQDEIIEKAIDLFSRRGYESVTIADLTDSLKMGKGSFYLYFKNKRDLLLECFNKLSSLIIPMELREQISGEEDFLLRMGKRWDGFQSQYKNFSQVLHLLRISTASEDPHIRENAIKSYDIMVQPLRGDIREAVHKGLVREMDPELITYALIGAAEQLAFRATLDKHYSEEAATKVVNYIIRSVLAPPPSAGEEQTGPEISGSVTDQKNVVTELNRIRIDGENSIQGRVGEAQVRIALANATEIAVQEPGIIKCQVSVTMKNGHSSTVIVTGDAVVSGDTLLGSLTIPLKKVSRVVLVSPRHAAGTGGLQC